jgi:hypothetical protein
MKATRNRFVSCELDGGPRRYQIGQRPRVHDVAGMVRCAIQPASLATTCQRVTRPAGRVATACQRPNRSDITATEASQAWFKQGRPNALSIVFSSEKWL